MKKRKVISSIILIIWFVFSITDFSLAKVNKTPIFATPVIRYKDGGSTEYYGLGYGVCQVSCRICYFIITLIRCLTDLPFTWSLCLYGSNP